MVYIVTVNFLLGTDIQIPVLFTCHFIGVKQRYIVWLTILYIQCSLFFYIYKYLDVYYLAFIFTKRMKTIYKFVCE
jgi:hypothetical protein